MSSYPVDRSAISGRILTKNDVLEFKWNPLEDRGSPPEYIPPHWTSTHAGKRLVKGLRTLKLMPHVSGPRIFGSAWPGYAHDWADLLAQQEADEADKQQVQRVQNRVRLRPSSIEIMHMEQSICWPARYLRDIPQLVRTVMLVALFRSRDRDMKDVTRRMKLPGRLVRRWNGEGLERIARGLRADRVRIF